MIINEGPLKRNQFKKQIIDKINRFRRIFFILFLGLPILIYFPFKYKLFNSDLSKGGDLAAVAQINTGDGTGTAFLISPTHAITARHVVEHLKDGSIVRLLFNKSEPSVEVEAKVLFVSGEGMEDYAELELTKPLTDHPTLVLGNIDNVSINDEVNIVGYPGGIFSSAKAQITNNEITNYPENFLMFGGAWPGNSGGPIIHTETGEVVGILIAGFENEFKGMVVGQKINSIKQNPKFKH
jgi:V8-like Glu-specific endopeptidase